MESGSPVLERSIPGFRAVFLGFTQIFAVVWPNLLPEAQAVTVVGKPLPSGMG
jgi:hypothetical protein